MTDGDRPAGTLTTVAARTLPVAPRERSGTLAALAVLLILGGALTTMMLVMNADERVSAILVTKPIGAGQPFGTGAIREARVVSDGSTYELWADRAQVAKSVAAVSLLPGTLVTTAMTEDWNKELLPGKARVGLALKPGQFPSGVTPGRRVQVVFVPAGNGQHRLLAPSALVDSASTGRNGTTGEVTVIADGAIAPEIAAYASSGEIVIAELPGSR
ncbi:hypothetical protein [Nonomuraea solani]|nr:hypothetical protein [Nonomuraea solani]